MPHPRTASPPTSPTDWSRGSSAPGGRASVAQDAPARRDVDVDVAATLAQRKRSSHAPRIVVATERDDDDDARAFNSLSLQPPASPNAPAGLLLFRRRSSTTLGTTRDDDGATTLPIHPLDVPPSRRSSDAASSALNQIASSTTSRRSSWSKSAAVEDGARPRRPSSSSSSSQHVPPPSASSALFAAAPSSASSFASASRYLGQHALSPIEASPLIPTSAETTPGTTPESSVELRCTPIFATSLSGPDESPPIEPFAKFRDTPVRRASYAVVTLDPHAAPPPAASFPPAPRSARSIRRQLRRVLVAAVSLFVLVCIVRPSRIALLPALAALHLSPLSSHSDASRFLSAPLRPGIWPRNKTYPGDEVEVGAAAVPVVGQGSSAAAVYPVRDGVKQFREEQLWAPSSAGPKLRTRVVEPRVGAEHEATIIMLHGLSQTVEHSSWLHAELGPKLPTVRWVMPQAPKLPITYHKQELRPAWFDIKAFPWNAVQDSDDEDHYFSSARAINAVLREERDRLIVAGRKRLGQDPTAPGSREEHAWASKRILLGGFSQGGVMTLLTGLTCEYELGGLFVFSGMLPVRTLLPELVRDLDRTDLPIWWGHGVVDPYLLYVAVSRATSSVDAAASVQVLRDPVPGGLALARVTFETYPRLAHTWSRTQVDDLTKWMRDAVGGPFVPVVAPGHPKVSRSRERR
ncbi:hypothetical protein JCM11491_003602 [Sporobolomyces phaffii]